MKHKHEGLVNLIFQGFQVALYKNSSSGVYIYKLDWILHDSLS